MTEITNVNIKRFDAGEGYWVDIVDNDGLWEIWLQNPEYGMSYLMFGLTKADAKTTTELLPIVKSYLPQYKVIYHKQVIEKSAISWV